MLLLLAALTAGATCAARGQENPFPPGDLRVLASPTQSQRFRLRFERLGPAIIAAGQTCPAKASYLLAGAAAQPPQVRIVSSHYYRFLNRRVVGETHAMDFGEAPTGGASAIVQISDAGRLRQYHVYRLTVSRIVSRAGRAEGENWLMNHVEAEIDLGPAGNTTAFTTETVSRESWAAQPGGQSDAWGLLNPDVDPAYHVAGDPRAYAAHTKWAAAINADLDRGQVYRMTVYKPGVYAIPARLCSADSVCRVRLRGNDVPLFTDDAAGANRTMFAVAPFNDAADGPPVYWLSVTPHGSEGTSAPRAVTIPRPDSVPTTTATAAAAPSAARFTVVADVPGDYHPRIRPDAGVTRWFWKSLSDRQVGEFHIDLPAHYRPESVLPGRIDLAVHHAMAHHVPQPPAVELIVNGVPDQLSTASANQGVIRYASSPPLFRAGRNVLGLRMAYPGGAGGQQDLLVQKIAATWTQPLADAAQTTGLFTLSDAAASRLVAPHADSASSEPLLVELGGESPCATRPSILANPGSSSTLVYSAAGAGFQSPCMFVIPERVPEPPRVERAAPLRLFDPHPGADYIAITTPALKPALMPLLQHRARQGWNVLVVDVQTLYDHFSHGEARGEAIRTFLAWALETWPGVKPRCVLLAGEAADYRGDPALLGTRLPSEIVPVCVTSHADGPRGDHPYAAVLGTDSLCDLAVGRLPVASPDELASVAAKILQYENAPAGAWASRAIVVEDDNEEFPRAVADVLSRGTGPALSISRFLQSDYEYVPNVKVAGRKRPRTATRQLVEAFNNGLGLVCFFGHGGPNLWTHERLLHLQDLPLLKNAPRLPLVVCASCDNAWLDYPVAPVQRSMGELLVTKPDGAIGVFGPVSGASPFEHATLVGRLVEGISRAGLRRMGDIVSYAKNYYLADTGSSSVPEQYVLIGDPAVELRTPVIDRGLDVAPPVVQVGRNSSVRVSATELASTGAAALLRLQDLRSGTDLLSQTVAIAGGTAQTALAVGTLDPGNHALALHAESSGSVVAATGRLPIEEPRPALAVEQGDVVGSSPLHARVINPCLGRIDGVRLVSQPNGTSGAASLEDLFTLQARSSRQYPLGLLAGATDGVTVSLSVGSGAADVIHVPMSAAAEAGLWVDAPGLYCPAGQLTAADSASLAIGLYCAAQHDARRLRVSLAEGGTNLCPPVTIAPVPGRNRIDFSMAKPLAAGTRTLAVEVAEIPATTATAERTILRHTQDVEVLGLPDLHFLADSVKVRAPGNQPRAGQTVFVDAVLVNSGESVARSVALRLLIGGAVNGTPAATINDLDQAVVPEVPGKSRVPVTFRWENPSAGTHTCTLAVNRQKALRETNYDNNTVELPPIAVVQMGDFHIPSYEIARHHPIAPGMLGLRVTCRQDGGTTRGPLRVEYGTKNTLTGASETQTTSIREIGPDKSVALDLATSVAAGMSVAYATVNADREHEEVDTGNDTVTTTILPLQRLSDAAGGDGRFELPLSDCWAEGMELLPGGGLRVTDRFTASTGLIPVSKELVAGGDVSDLAAPNQGNDNKWLVAPWLLEAHGTESPGRVNLRVPLPGGVPAGPCELRVELLAPPIHKGSPTGSFQLAMEGGPMRPVTYQPVLGGTGKCRAGAGTFTTRDGVLDLAIEPTSGTAAALLAFEAVRSYGHAVSPAFELPGGRAGGRGRIEFRDTATSAGAVTYSARGGTPRGQGRIEWSEWIASRGRAVEFAALPSIVQWQAIVLCQQGGIRPIVESAVLLRE